MQSSATNNWKCFSYSSIDYFHIYVAYIILFLNPKSASNRCDHECTTDSHRWNSTKSFIFCFHTGLALVRGFFQAHDSFYLSQLPSFSQLPDSPPMQQPHYVEEARVNLLPQTIVVFPGLLSVLRICRSRNSRDSLQHNILAGKRDAYIRHRIRA
jgi:hypothetical protein